MSPCQKDFDTKYYKKGMFLDGSHVLWEKYSFFFCIVILCNDFSFYLFCMIFWLCQLCLKSHKNLVNAYSLQSCPLVSCPLAVLVGIKHSHYQIGALGDF